MAWFEERGVALKVEDDGRVFPVSDDSQTIIDCLLRAARDAGVEVRTETAVASARQGADGGIELILERGDRLRARYLLLTLGGTRNRVGADIAASFGSSSHS